VSAEKAPLWRDILSGASSAAPGSTETKTLVVLGEEGVGKDSIINSLRRSGSASEHGSKMALEYTFIDPFGPEDDDVLAPRLNVWKINGQEQKHLLKFALNPKALNSTIAVVVVDFSQPWAFLKSLQEWLDILEEQLLAAYDECPETGLDTEHQEAQVRWFQNYVEPSKDSTAKPSTFSTDAAQLAGGEDILLPLGEGTLTKNLGLPILIACNKSDLMASMEKNFEYQDSDFDFIQQHLRKFALQYGATLVYTSTKTGKGADLLGEYIAHRLLGSNFITRAQVLDKDTIFVPCGYDSLEKITVLDDPSKVGDFEEVIAPPVSKAKAAREEEMVQAEDDQAFLERQHAELDKASKGERPARPAPRVELLSGSDGASAGVSTPNVGGAPPTASSLTPGSSAMLQSFFESLMKSESNEGLRKDVEGVIADEKKKGAGM